MKKILLLSAALIAALAGPALAQRDNSGRGDGPRATQGQPDGNRGGGFRGGDRGDRGGFGRSQQAAPQVQQQAAPQAQRQAAPQAQRRAAPQVQQAQRNDGRRDFNQRGNNRPDVRRGNDRRDFGRNDRGWDNRPGFNNQRYSQYYRNWSSPQRYRAGIYYRPQGFSYRRWTYGDILPSLYWGNRYWLNNYYAYDLPPPPPGTVWVRYGDDALLIDRYTGEVIQVSYSVFW